MIKKSGIKVLVTGTFNVLHPGHLRLLKFAKECGDYLIVGVKSDALAGDEAHLSEKYRLDSVASNSLVDEAVITNNVSELIELVRPEIVVKGKEYELKSNPELEILRGFGGKLLFSSGESTFSSLDLLRNEYALYGRKSLLVPKEYIERHKINKARLIEIIEKFQDKRICIIGDLIVDEYITCEPLGMSQEDPTIVVTPIEANMYVGGAAIVAAHAKGLGANVEFISVCGWDSCADYVKNELLNLGIKADLICDASRPTTLKQRYRSKGKTLLKVSKLHQDSISLELQDRIIKKFRSMANSLDLLVFSDFNYGCLPQGLVDKINEIAEEHNILVTADSQSSSQVGDIARFKKTHFLTPTEREARLSTRNQGDGLVVLAEELKNLSESKYILLKLGEEGLIIHSGGNDPQGWVTDRIGALNPLPIDVAGAGDSLLISASLAVATGANIWEAAYIGSIAAALQVSRIGNIPLKKVEVVQEIQIIK